MWNLSENYPGTTTRLCIQNRYYNNSSNNSVPRHYYSAVLIINAGIIILYNKLYPHNNNL